MFRRKEHVVPLGIGFGLSAGASQEALIQTDGSCHLVCTVAYVHGAKGEFCIIKFVGASLTKFGSPNDEGLGGHPLFGRGLQFYSAGEVINSRWNAEVERQERISFPSARSRNRRHFIFAMKENTFECLAQSFEVSRSDGPLSAILDRIVKSLG
jgi:hypothetical protein